MRHLLELLELQLLIEDLVPRLFAPLGLMPLRVKHCLLPLDRSEFVVKLLPILGNQSFLVLPDGRLTALAVSPVLQML